MTRSAVPPASDRDEGANDGRARNGGRARPGDGSVWDLEPLTVVETDPGSRDQLIAEPDQATASDPTAETIDPAGTSDQPVGSAMAIRDEPSSGATGARAGRRGRGRVAKVAVGLLTIGAVAAGLAFVMTGGDADTPTESGDGGASNGLVATTESADAAIDVSELIAAAESSGSDGDADDVGEAATRPTADRVARAARGEPLDDARDVATAASAAPDDSPEPAASESEPAAPPESDASESEPPAPPESAASESESAPPEPDVPDDEPAAPAGAETGEPSAAPASGGRGVEIVGRTEACRFGSNCLVAGFELHGFDAGSREFVCEFASGRRYTFSATTTSVDYACATGKADDSITIEVDGVRSDTITRD